MNPTPRQGKVDLAFVCVVHQEGAPFFNSRLAARSSEVGDPVALVLKAGTDSGRISAVPVAQAANNDTFPPVQASGLQGVPGDSGSIVISPAGLVGLHLGSFGGGTEILPLSTIRTLAERSGLPWRLTEFEFFDCAKSRRLCTTTDKTSVDPGAISMTGSVQGLPVTVRAGTCTEVPEGRYQIHLGDDASCEPKFITVLSAPEPLTLALKCAPSFMGNWQSATGDELLCAETEVGSAQCGGLTSLGLGYLQARLSASGSHIQLIGMFADPAGNQSEATGTLEWTAAHLVGDIRYARGQLIHLDLKRVSRQ